MSGDTPRWVKVGGAHDMCESCEAELLAKADSFFDAVDAGEVDRSAYVCAEALRQYLSDLLAADIASSPRCARPGCDRPAEYQAGHLHCYDHIPANQSLSLRVHAYNAAVRLREQRAADGEPYCKASSSRANGSGGPCKARPIPGADYCRHHADEVTVFAWEHGKALGQLGLDISADLYAPWGDLRIPVRAGHLHGLRLTGKWAQCLHPENQDISAGHRNGTE